MWGSCKGKEKGTSSLARVVDVCSALLEYVGLCGLKVEMLFFEVWWSDEAVAGKEGIVVKGSKEGVVGNALSRACDFEDELSKDFEKSRTVWKGGEDVIFCYFGGNNGVPLISVKLCVDDSSKQEKARVEEESVVLGAVGKSEKG